MKKIIILLSILILVVTGCSVQSIKEDNIHDNIKNLLSKKVKLTNVYYEGYKYYIPKGISFVEKDDYNAILLDGNNNKYYIYVDVISYYNKIKNDYETNQVSFYSEYLEFNKKNGFIQIDKIKSKYYIQFVFNYVKMEAYVSYKEINSVITNMCSIIRSFQFNHNVLESLVGENKLDYKEEDYTLFKADSSKEAFLDVVEREETDRYKKDLEDEKIDLDE